MLRDRLSCSASIPERGQEEEDWVRERKNKCVGSRCVSASPGSDTLAAALASSSLALKGGKKKREKVWDTGPKEKRKRKTGVKQDINQGINGGRRTYPSSQGINGNKIVVCVEQE